MGLAGMEWRWGWVGDGAFGDEVEIEMGMMGGKGRIRPGRMGWRAWGLWEWTGERDGVGSCMDDIEIEIRVGVNGGCKDRADWDEACID